MVLVSEYCAQLLNCRLRTLRDRINHPEDRVRLINALKGRKVRTTYKDRNGETKTFFADGLSALGAAHTMAYGRLPRPYNINIAGHFYCRHRIKLHYPYLPCVIEHFPGGEDRYYPIELLELIDDQKSVKQSRWWSNLCEEEDSQTASPRPSTSTTDTQFHFRPYDLMIDEGAGDSDGGDKGRDECW